MKEEKRKIKIHRSRERVKDQMPWAQVDDKKFEKAYKISFRLKRSELVLFWLQECAKESEEYFEDWLRRIPKWSNQDLADVMYELGPESIDRFLDKFGKR